MRRPTGLARWLATLAVTCLPFLSATLPSNSAVADVAPGPFRPRPQPSIIWREVKPVDPVLQLARPAAAPMSLTSSDGAGLELVSLEAKAVVEDPLTFTELHLTFRNPEPRVREGQFEIVLPPLMRFAVWLRDQAFSIAVQRSGGKFFCGARSVIGLGVAWTWSWM